MTPELPSRGPERQIFVQALRAYSDACTAPELTPACPFFSHGPDGPVCADECMDLLSAHPAIPAQAPLTLDLRHGLEAEKLPRSRTRRGPDETCRPFDARGEYLADRDKPRDARSIPSLVFELGLDLSGPPGLATDERELSYSIGANFDHLARRGVAVENLVRFGLASRFVLGAAFSLMAEPSETGPVVAGWRAFFTACWEADQALGNQAIDFQGFAARVRELAPDLQMVADTPPDVDAVNPALDPNLMMYALAGPFVGRVLSWLATAPIAEVLTWKPPDPEVYGSRAPLPVCAVDQQERMVGRWLSDRFSRTYLTSWHLDSLRLEWKWLSAQSSSPAPAAIMRARHLEPQTVAASLADVSAGLTESASRAEEPDQVEGPLADFVYLAVNALRDGRRYEAIGLYRAVVAMQPDDPQVANNYGFCMLLDQPESAQLWLERAAKMAFPVVDPTNLANRLFAAVQQGKHEAALELAESLLPLPAHCPPAFLWVKGEDGPVLADGQHPIVYGMRLAAEAASCIGDGDRAALWTGRAVTLERKVA